MNAPREIQLQTRHGIAYMIQRLLTLSPPYLWMFFLTLLLALYHLLNESLRMYRYSPEQRKWMALLA